MDSLFFHPRLVHLPLALGVLMPLIAGGLLLATRRGWLPAGTWWVAVAFQAVLAGSATAAVFSGEAEAERVEAVVPEAALEAHHDLAEQFWFVSLGVLAALAAGGFGPPRRRAAVGAAGVAGTVVALVLGVRAGEAGGELVYRHGAADAYTGGAPGGASPRPADDD